MKVNFEHTDTFGGEANYSWVKRGTIELPDSTIDQQIVKAVKRELEMTGVKCDRVDYSGNEMIILKPRGIHQIIFITFG